MVYDSECLVRIGVNPGGEAAPLRIVNDQDTDVCAMFVPQLVDLLHVPIALVREAPDMVEMRSLFDIVGLIGVYESQLDMAQAAHSKGFIALLNGELNKLFRDVAVIGRGLLG